jgi:catechol 2,3-dioxygenase-like lactoylglutathione lyase family enzyme
MMAIHIGHAAPRVTDADRYAAFATAALGLRETGRTATTILLSASEKHHELVHGDQNGIDHVGLEVESSETLRAVRTGVERAGITCQPLAESQATGLGDATRFTGPGGQEATQGTEGDRPNYAPGFGPHSDCALGTAAHWYNSVCYVLEPYGTVGNVGRNSIIGPGLTGLDFAIVKETKISERVDTQFRAEFFNILNHRNFMNSSSASGPFVGTAGVLPGQSYPAIAPSANAAPNPTAGQITSTATSSRQIQFALKFNF